VPRIAPAPAGWAALMYSTPDGSKTLAASLTIGDAEIDFAGWAEAFLKAQHRLVEEAFCGGQDGSART